MLLAPVELVLLLPPPPTMFVIGFELPVVLAEPKSSDVFLLKKRSNFQISLFNKNASLIYYQHTFART